MATKVPAIVKGRDGLLGTIEPPDRVPDKPGATVEVRLDDGRKLQVPSSLLLLQEDGTYAMALSVEEVERLGEVEHSPVVVPVVAEEIEVGKRKVETGRVRVRKTVRTTDQVVDEPVMVEEVEVERIPINRRIDEPVGPRQEGDTLIVPLLEEILVVEKRLMLKEEVRITRRRVEQRSSQTVTLRSEEATVERAGSGDDGSPTGDRHA